MTLDDIKNKNLVLCQYIQSVFTYNYTVKAEFSTDDSGNKNVIVVQEETGPKIVLYDNNKPLFNYYNIDIFGTSIQSQKNASVVLGNLIGQQVLINFNNQKWQIIFMQISNPRAVEYMDIRRVSYNLTLKCIVNRVA